MKKILLTTVLLATTLLSAADTTFKIEGMNLACEHDVLDTLTEITFKDKPKQWLINDIRRDANCFSINKGETVKLIEWKNDGKIIVEYNNKRLFLKSYAKN